MRQSAALLDNSTSILCLVHVHVVHTCSSGSLVFSQSFCPPHHHGILARRQKWSGSWATAIFSMRKNEGYSYYFLKFTDLASQQLLPPHGEMHVFRRVAQIGDASQLWICAEVILVGGGVADLRGRLS